MKKDKSKMRIVMSYGVLFCFIIVGLICSCTKPKSVNSSKNPLNNYEVVYSWNNNRYAELRTINLLTKKVTTLYKVETGHTEDDEGKFVRFYNASWSKDGNNILFAGDRITSGTASAELYFLNMASKKTVFIADTGLATWRLDNKILFGEYGLIYEYDILTRTKKQLIKRIENRGVETKSDMARDYQEPLLSKDKTKILCVVNLNSIVLRDIKSGQDLRLVGGMLTEHYGQLHNSWSPDGKKIVYLGWKEPTLNIINIDGTGHKKIYEGKKGHRIERPAWSPDGKKIAFRETWITGNVRHGNLLVLDVKTRKIKRLGGGRHPVWFPDGKRIVLDKGKLTIVNLKTGKEEQLPSGRVTDLSPFAIKPIISKDTAKVTRTQRNDKKIKEK